MDTESRRLWETVTGDLDEVGRLAHSDGNALAQYVAMLAQWQRLATFLHAHGETAAVRHTYHVPERCAADGERLPSHRVETSRQELRPEAKLALALADRLLRLEEQLGLRPTSRASISAALTAARKATSGHPLTLDPRRFWRLQA
jgi:P27 family predicted phage terminase small subunit